MAWVYILRGSTGRHYIGSTINLERRLSEHRNGGTHTTQRLGEHLETVAILELETIEQARLFERQLKAKKIPKLAIAMLQGLQPPSLPA
jgi:putative endonuclease